MTSKIPTGDLHTGSILFAVIVAGPFGIYQAVEWFGYGIPGVFGWFAGVIIGVIIGELWVKGLELKD